jgi:hypothetical protein
MKSFHSTLAAGAVAAAVASADAALIAGWTMPSAFPTGTGNVPTGTFYRPPLAVNSDGTYNANPNNGGTTWDSALAGRADVGDKKLLSGFELSSTHQLSASGANLTSYTSPAGNGSPYAFSSNVWKAGDWYQVAFSTVGYTGVSFSFDMTRSSTGPASWTIEMSTDGGASFGTTLSATFVPIVANAAGSGTVSWTSSTNQPVFTSTYSLGAAADDRAGLVIRIRALVDSVNSSNVFQAGGTARVDNLMLNGTLVPAPGALALLAAAGMVGGSRRRR